MAAPGPGGREQGPGGRRRHSGVVARLGIGWDDVVIRNCIVAFNGHGLEPDMEYTLIYYPDPWPGDGLICFGSGIADFEGDVHIKGHLETGDLPGAFDENPGAKIWLALTADVDCIGQNMVGWNPGEYLFEYELITFDDTDM